MDEFSPEFSAKIREAYAQGHDPEDIIAHFQSTKNPEGLKWANQMKELQGGSDVVPVLGPTSSGAPSFRDTTSPLMDTFSRNAELVKEQTKDMTLEDQAILGAKVAGGLYAGKKAIDIGSRMLNNLTPQGMLEIEKAKADLEASKESARNYGIQTQTAAQKLELEKQLAANAQPSSLEELKARALMNAEKRAQELHEFKMESLKQQQIKKATQVDKIAASPTLDPMLTPEIQQSTGFTGLQEIEKKHGVFKENQADYLRMALQSEQNRLAKEADVLSKAQQAGVTPTTSVPEAETLVASRQASLTPVEKIAESIKPPLSTDLRTGSGMPAIQGTAPPGTPFRKEIPSAANIPSTHAFVPGGQYMDIVRNAVGQDAYTASLLKSGGYPQTPEEAYSLSRMINESMSRMPRDVAKDLNIGLGDTTKAITQKVAGGKAVKLAGATGALILMTDLANAKTPQEKREAMRNLGEAILPTSMTSTEAGAPTLSPGAYTESRKLGSPFYKMFKEGAAPPSMR